jgi:hypothetical protein
MSLMATMYDAYRAIDARLRAQEDALDQTLARRGRDLEQRVGHFYFVWSEHDGQVIAACTSSAATNAAARLTGGLVHPPQRPL